MQPHSPINGILRALQAEPHRWHLVPPQHYSALRLYGRTGLPVRVSRVQGEVWAAWVDRCPHCGALGRLEAPVSPNARPHHLDPSDPLVRAARAVAAKLGIPQPPTDPDSSDD